MFSNGEIIEGRSYSDILALAKRVGMTGERIHGFINSYGDFLLPSEAANVAHISGQITSRVDELSPEDLWPVLQRY